MKLNTLLSRAEVKKEWSRVMGLCHSLPPPQSVKVAIIPFIVPPNAHNFLEKVNRRETNLKVPEFKLTYL